MTTENVPGMRKYINWLFEDRAKKLLLPADSVSFFPELRQPQVVPQSKQKVFARALGRVSLRALETFVEAALSAVTITDPKTWAPALNDWRGVAGFCAIGLGVVTLGLSSLLGPLPLAIQALVGWALFPAVYRLGRVVGEAVVNAVEKEVGAIEAEDRDRTHRHVPPLAEAEAEARLRHGADADWRAQLPPGENR